MLGGLLARDFGLRCQQAQLQVGAARLVQPLRQRRHVLRSVGLRQRQALHLRVAPASCIGQGRALELQRRLGRQHLGARAFGAGSGLVGVGDRRVAELEAVLGLDPGALHRGLLALQTLSVRLARAASK